MSKAIEKLQAAQKQERRPYSLPRKGSSPKAETPPSRFAAIKKRGLGAKPRARSGLGRMRPPPLLFTSFQA